MSFSSVSVSLSSQQIESSCCSSSRMYHRRQSRCSRLMKNWSSVSGNLQPFLKRRSGGVGTSASRVFCAKKKKLKKKKPSGRRGFGVLVDAVISSSDVVARSSGSSDDDENVDVDATLNTTNAKMFKKKKNKVEIKVICSDVDGTLVTNADGFSLTGKTEAMIKKALLERKVPTMIATGKTRGPWAEKLFSELNQDEGVPGVFVQGTVMYDGLGNVLESLTLPPVAAEAICGYCRIRGISVVAFCEEKIVCEKRDAQTDLVMEYGEAEPISVPKLSLYEKKPNKMILFWDEETNGSKYENFARFREEAEKMLGNYDVDMTVAVDGMLEFLPKGASKGAVVKRACERILNVEMENVLAIGDAENDLDLLKMAGTSVAVANAKDSVKKVATFTTNATNEEGAVGEAIEKFVFAAADEYEEKKEEEGKYVSPPQMAKIQVAETVPTANVAKKKPSMTKKSSEFKIVTKEATEFARANLSETISKVKAEIEKFDKKEFEEKIMKTVVKPVVKSVRAAQGGGNADLAQRRAEMDAENAKRLSDESKSDEASAAKKKLAAKAAVRAAESASKAAILEAELVSSSLDDCKGEECEALEPKAAELTERLAQLQRGLEFEKRKLAEAERLSAFASASASATTTTTVTTGKPQSPSPSPPTPTPKATTSTAAPSSALIEPMLEEPEFSLPAAALKKSPPATKGVKSYKSASASFKKTKKEKGLQKLNTTTNNTTNKNEKTESEVKAAWKEPIKSEDNSVAWKDEKQQEKEKEKTPAAAGGENNNNFLAAFAASALKTVQTLTSPEARMMQRNAEIAALKAEVIKKALNLDSGRNGDVTEEQLEDFKVTLRKLEAMNNTKTPTRSTLINGQWSLAFTNDTDLLRVGKRRGIFGTRNKRSEGTIDFAVDVFANDDDLIKIEDDKKPKNKMRYEILRSWPQSSETGELTVLSTNALALSPPKTKLFGFIPIGGGGKKNKTKMKRNKKAAAIADEGEEDADENEPFDENELATYQSLVVSYLDLEMLSFRSGVDDCVYVFLQKDVEYRVGRGKKKLNSVNKQLK